MLLLNFYKLHIHTILLSVRPPILFHKRFMIKTAAAKAVHSTEILNNRLLVNKMVFIRFCDHFKTIPLASLMNDSLFIEWAHNCNHKDPTLQSRAFQLALEVTYNKRQFSQKSLEDFYKNDFKIEDIFKTNKGLCDQSTIYSSIMSKYVTDYFNLNSDELTVNSTPFLLNKQNVTTQMQKIMDLNKTLTDNSVPDVMIKQRPYDFKDISWNKNHIYLLDAETIKQHGEKMLSLLTASLNNQIKIKTLSPPAEKYAEHLLTILKNKESPIQEIFEKVYKYTITHQPPKDFRLPLVIPIKKANSAELQTKVSTKEVEEVKLDQGHLTDVKTRNALKNIQDKWDMDLKGKIHQAMKGAFSYVLPVDNDIQ